MGLHLCEAAIHKQFRSSDVAAVFGREEHDGPGDLFGCPEPADRTMVGIIFLRCSPTSEDASRPVAAGVLIEPGAYRVHANAPILEIRCPGSGERTYRGFFGAINAIRGQSLAPRDLRIEDD
jgi:hypothetical protein